MLFRSNPLVVLTPVVLLITLIGLATAPPKQPPAKPTQYGLLSPTVSPCQSTPYEPQATIRSSGLWTPPPKDAQIATIFLENSLESLSLGADIKTFDIHQPSRQIVYVEKLNEKKVVRLYNLETNSSKQIYEQDIIAGDDSGDYFLEIKDVDFSPDGTKIAISATTAIYQYDISSGVITKLFEIPKKKPFTFGVYGLYSPKFSQNNRFISYYEGYYEGRSFKVYDIQTSSPIDVDYGGYITGTLILGWYENMMVIENYQTENSRFSLVNPLAPSSETLIVNASGDFIRSPQAVISGSYIYFTEYTSENLGYIACNDTNEPYEVTSDLGALKRIQIETKKIDTIAEWDETRSYGVINKAPRVTTIKSFVGDVDEGILMTVTNGTSDTQEPYFVENSVSAAILKMIR